VKLKKKVPSLAVVYEVKSPFTTRELSSMFKDAAKEIKNSGENLSLIVKIENVDELEKFLRTILDYDNEVRKENKIVLLLSSTLGILLGYAGRYFMNNISESLYKGQQPLIGKALQVITPPLLMFLPFFLTFILYYKPKLYEVKMREIMYIHLPEENRN